MDNKPKVCLIFSSRLFTYSESKRPNAKQTAVFLELDSPNHLQQDQTLVNPANPMQFSIPKLQACRKHNEQLTYPTHKQLN